MFSSRFIKGYLLIGLLLFCFCSGCNKKVEAGPSAPDFTLEDLSGTKVSLRDHQGKIVVLDFWATWCPPCRQSIPELVALQKKYREKDVVVIGISLDHPTQIKNSDLSAFKEKYNMNYIMLRANPKVAQDYFGNYQISIPTMFIIDKSGKIADKLVGYTPGAADRSIRNLL